VNLRDGHLESYFVDGDGEFICEPGGEDDGVVGAGRRECYGEGG